MIIIIYSLRRLYHYITYVGYFLRLIYLSIIIIIIITILLLESFSHQS